MVIFIVITREKFGYK